MNENSVRNQRVTKAFNIWMPVVTMKASKITTLATGLITCQFSTYGNMSDPQELLSKNLAYSKIHMLDNVRA